MAAVIGFTGRLNRMTGETGEGIITKQDQGI
jgi:hypothetical protein